MSNLPIILAVDLGQKGGMVWNKSVTGVFLGLAEMPKDDFGRAALILECKPDIIVAENVHMWAGSSSQAGGTLMEGKGFLNGVASSIGITVEWIEPLKWIECYTLKRTKHFVDKKGKRDKKAWKTHLMNIAKKLDESLVNDITLGTADAFLMWNYIARKESGNPMKKIGVI